MRKIHVVVLDTFGTKAEASTFRSEAISRLRAEYPAAVVQVDFARSLREPVVLHAYGFDGADKSQVEEAAGRIVAELLGALGENSSPFVDSCESSPGSIRDSFLPEVENEQKTHCPDSA